LDLSSKNRANNFHLKLSLCGQDSRLVKYIIASASGNTFDKCNIHHEDVFGQSALIGKSRYIECKNLWNFDRLW